MENPDQILLFLEEGGADSLSRLEDVVNKALFSYNNFSPRIIIVPQPGSHTSKDGLKQLETVTNLMNSDFSNTETRREVYKVTCNGYPRIIFVTNPNQYFKYHFEDCNGYLSIMVQVFKSELDT